MRPSQLCTADLFVIKLFQSWQTTFLLRHNRQSRKGFPVIHSLILFLYQHGKCFHCFKTAQRLISIMTDSNFSVPYALVQHIPVIFSLLPSLTNHGCMKECVTQQNNVEQASFISNESVFWLTLVENRLHMFFPT
jgi:hypothetical protein